LLRPRSPPAQSLVSTIIIYFFLVIRAALYWSLFNVSTVVYGNLHTLCCIQRTRSHLIAVEDIKELRLRMLSAFYITLIVRYCLHVTVFFTRNNLNIISNSNSTLNEKLSVLYVCLSSIMGSCHWLTILMFPWQPSLFFKSLILSFIMSWKINFLIFEPLPAVF